MDKLHLIGNAHLDPVWLWRWQQGYAEIKATYRSALDRMKEYPDYIFTSACAAYYEFVEQNDPEMFAEIVERVKEGRWAIAGGWWIQPDCNIPNGESFARHALYSQRYFMEKFGKIAKTGYNVDSFGHNGMIPQLLKKSGMDNYVWMRPDQREKELNGGSVYWWESPDGSRVLTYRIPMGYGSSNEPERNIEKMNKMRDLAKEEGQPLMAFYGVGNHGGGPTKRTLNAIMKDIEEGGDDLKFSSPDEYFKEIREIGGEHQVLTEDLQNHASGCYSTTSHIKAANRRSEHRLMLAEKAMMLAQANIDNYKACPKKLREAWTAVLFNQFHDIMGGCSIREAYDDAMEGYGFAQYIANHIINDAFQRISFKIDTIAGREGLEVDKDGHWYLWTNRGTPTPVVVFNLHSHDVKAPVQVTRSKGISDENFNPVPSQIVRASRSNNDDKWDTVFMAEVPAMGWRVYNIHLEDELEVAHKGVLECGSNWIRNDFFHLELDPRKGYISRFVDLKTKKNIFDGPAAVPLVIDDEKTDTWAHMNFFFRDVVGKFEDARVQLIEAGPLRATLRVTSKWGDSTFRQDITMYRGGDQVDVKCLLNWQEPVKMVKLSFPVATENPKTIWEIPYGAQERPMTGREMPGQQWACVYGEEGGVAVINDSKYSYDVLDNALSVTLVRSSYYTDHYTYYRDDLMDVMDLGEHRFKYSIVPFKGDWQDAQLQQRANILNAPLESINETYHDGKLSRNQSGIKISDDKVICTVVKPGEERGTVLRLVETTGKPVKVNVSSKMLGLDCELSFGGFEIKTIMFDNGKVEEILLTELE